ncbi:MAG TPA: metallophosphoesterase [Bryobacterales bacterium]|nr:metallophosphoesterase [Bryobacterales bacterium]
MSQSISYWFDAVLLTVVLAAQVCLYQAAQPALRRWLRPRGLRAAQAALAALLAGALLVVALNSEQRFWRASRWLNRSLTFAAAIWVAGSVGAAVILAAAWLATRRSAPGSAGKRAGAGRRSFLAGAARLAALAPFGVAGYATLLVRREFEVRETDFPVPNLPADLEGLRLAQLSDIHFSPYLTLPELERVVAMANETRPQVALVTGDLITRRGDSLEACLARLARLRAEAGVFGCLGNHEIYAGCEDLTERRGRELGIEFLRGERRALRFGGARLNVAGVDYQRQRRPYLAGAERLLDPGAINLLLSHNPDVFPVAADLGYDLIVGGHTHGGQVTVEILEQTLNVARFFTPYVAGLYRRGASSIYVSRGIGTLNLPMRLGAKPEVSLLRLRRV